MPIIKSAIKRVRVSDRKRKKNLIVSKKYKELTKEFESLITEGKKAEATKLFPMLQKSIDLADKKNLLHSNTAARRKSKLARMLQSETPAKTTKKAPAKKAAAKK